MSLYSLYGGSQQQVQTSNKIADSFPGMDTFAQAPLPQSNLAPVVYNDLKTPPVWMKKPVGASFGVNISFSVIRFQFLIFGYFLNSLAVHYQHSTKERREK